MNRLLGSIARAAPGAVAGRPVARVWHNPAPPYQPGVFPSRQVSPVAVRVLVFYGLGEISGSVTVEGMPAARRVRLYDARTGLLIGEVWSRADGLYRFSALDLGRSYCLVAHDDLGGLNAVVADGVTAEAQTAGGELP